MSTSSLIGIQIEDNVKYIYCHWDGYPSHHGPILNQYYNNEHIVNKLIDMGDLSVLSKYIAPINPPHSFLNPDKDICVFYGRDKGESDTGPITISLQEFLNPELEKKYFANYKYLFSNDRWWYVNENDMLEKIKE